MKGVILIIVGLLLGAIDIKAPIELQLLFFIALNYINLSHI
jgi:hypothetical protein